jgi:hypothetical protein
MAVCTNPVSLIIACALCHSIASDYPFGIFKPLVRTISISHSKYDIICDEKVNSD